MPKVTFKIGKAFPFDEPVARFITVLAMMSNDWLRSMEDMFALENSTDPDAGGRRVALFRQQAALHHEAASFVRETRRRFPEVDEFIQALSAEAKEEADRIVGGIDPASPRYHGDWLEKHRNVTFHYPEMHPDKAKHGREEIADALQSAADAESSIEYGESFGSVRFRFADEVAVQWLPDATESNDVVVNLREALLALSRFVQRAAQVYMASQPQGTFVTTPD